MRLLLNEKQVLQLSDFFSNMSVALLIGGLISPKAYKLTILYFVYGIINLYLSLKLLKN